MSPYERKFVDAVFSHKPNLQIYRTDDGTGLGDFLLVDLSNPNKPKGYLVELKMSPNSASAGHQLRNFEYVDQTMELKETEPLTGTIDEIIEIITHPH